MQINPSEVTIQAGRQFSKTEVDAAIRWLRGLGAVDYIAELKELLASKEYIGAYEERAHMERMRHYLNEVREVVSNVGSWAEVMPHADMAGVELEAEISRNAAQLLIDLLEQSYFQHPNVKKVIPLTIH
jgi:type VI protein secretion system component VasK